jgi:hypothetical protein
MNRSFTGYAIAAFAAYVLLFSSLRTAILGLAPVLGFLVLSRLVSMRHRFVYASYFVCWAGVVALTAYPGVLLALLPRFDVGFLNIYLYRSSAGVESAKELRQTVYRSAVWDYHFGVFFDHFPFGRGAEPGQTRATETSVLESVVHRPLTVDCRPASQPSVGNSTPAGASGTQLSRPRTPPTSAASSLPAEQSVGPKTTMPENRDTAWLSQFCLGCSFLTDWIARVGIAALFLVFFLGTLVARAITDQLRALYPACLILFPVAMYWGVLLVPYNPIFILFLGCAYLSTDVALAPRRFRLSK